MQECLHAILLTIASDHDLFLRGMPLLYIPLLPEAPRLTIGCLGTHNYVASVTLTNTTMVKALAKITIMALMVAMMPIADMPLHTSVIHGNVCHYSALR